MAIVAEFICYVCKRKFSMAYGGLFSNPMPLPNQICPHCKSVHEALGESVKRSIAQRQSTRPITGL